MTEDSCPRVSSAESDPSKTKQRKKRKWDQPDELLVSAGVAVPGIFPLANMGSLARITLPTVSAVPGASLAIPLQQHAAAIVQKLVQPKAKDELIAREIVINDADAAIRYKLTKRQTQEEIQKSTGAVVITRGKYRSPNALPDGERPLYLHISAAAHLDTTAERIKAVDQAAGMVEEMLKQATANNGVKVDHLLKTRVFLGFEADPSFNIVSRIRGPNDQYVNHIMNETGATVLLRGRGSGYSENGKCEETQQPLHLLLSSNDPKSLEHAKLLAENLLDTISAECGASRVSSCKAYGAIPPQLQVGVQNPVMVSSSKVYTAVPPPPQLQVGLQSPIKASEMNGVAAFSSSALVGVSSLASQGPLSQSIGLPKPGLPQANTACYPHTLTSGTSYIGYGGIYPQATPLQQVALALRQSTSPVTATVAPAITAASTEPPKDLPPTAKYKNSRKRKFQELPAAAKGSANLHQKNIQGSEFPMPRELTSHVGAGDISVVQDPKKSVKPSTKLMPPPPPLPPPRSLQKPSTDGMPPPPPPPRSLHKPSTDGMPPPPPPPPLPPPKFNSAMKMNGVNEGIQRPNSEAVPDTLIKLMEYGDDDDDDDDDDDPEETAKGRIENHSSAPAIPKPFWAV